MNQDTPLPRIHARFVRRRKTKLPNFLLGESDFRFVADCERMRVDRNGSVVSLLFVTLPTAHSSHEEVMFLARVLEGRLRMTDTAGRLKDGRIAVLLPDTPEEGAWKVATDVSEVYPPGPTRPECDVLVYPNPHSDVPRRHAQQEDETVAIDFKQSKTDSTEMFFAKPTPFWKRALDLMGGTVGLALGSPVLLTAALAIKATSPGPVFFRQEREGLGGRRFKIIKLRTMCVDAEEQKSRLRKYSEQDGPAFKLKADPRTTKVGRFLRWSSIDELPQFINVLKGEMSLVGPRPLPTEESTACNGWQRRRLSVKPGMTCTWQVFGRGNVLFDDWVRMDLQYARQSHPLHDLKLMFATIPSLIFHRGIR